MQKPKWYAYLENLHEDAQREHNEMAYLIIESHFPHLLRFISLKEDTCKDGTVQYRLNTVIGACKSFQDIQKDREACIYPLLLYLNASISRLSRDTAISEDELTYLVWNLLKGDNLYRFPLVKILVEVINPISQKEARGKNEVYSDVSEVFNVAFAIHDSREAAFTNCYADDLPSIDKLNDHVSLIGIYR